MHTLDWFVVGAYFVALFVMGLWLARRGQRNANDYFLGNNRLPWWALGASGMSSNLDVAGTMAIVAMISLYGFQGLFIELRGGVVIPIAVFLAFMGKWHRRSQVMTTAEWMLLRFGDNLWGRAARFTAALTYVILTIAMIVFFLTAGGQFLAEFLPFTPIQCATAVALIALSYTLVGGLEGVIWTDVLQAGLIGAMALYVSIIAAWQVTPELLASWPAASLNTFWPGGDDALLAPYSPFWAFLVVWFGKGVLEGLGGSGGSAYMAQRFYAARSERDCRKIGLLWALLFSARWPMVLGFALLALKLGFPVTNATEAEAILPAVLRSELFPIGVRGLIIAAMLAAAMSTFDSTINAGASYLVCDLYQPLRPAATERQLARAGYLASVFVVAAGLILSFTLGASILELWIGIVMLLFPAFLVPFALRWFWARFNGAGFVCGIAAGFVAAWWFAWMRPTGWNEATQFLAITAVSTVVSLLATWATQPVDGATLRNFYAHIRPFGLWPRKWRAPDRIEHRRDVLVLVVAIIWQLLTFLVPMGAVLGLWSQVAPGVIVWIALGIYLWRAPDPKTPQSRPT